MSVRTVLLSGASCVALLIEAAPGHAVDLRQQMGGAVSAASAAAAAAQANAAQAAALAQQSQQSMTATMRALQQMQQAQSAARNLAIAAPTTVPNGLTVGGLNPDSGPTPVPGSTTYFTVPSSWQNIGSLSQTQNAGSTTVTIGQNAPHAIATWTTFNAGVTLPMSANQVTIVITAAEVADDPLARSLIGQTVTIDARLSGTRADGFHWVGSPILDAAGFVGLVPVTIDQILTVGGSFNATARNVIQQPGSVINVSGGLVNYSGGILNTTMLLGADGRIYNIGRADPTIAYVGIASGFTVNHAHWGVTETWSTPQLELAQGQIEPGYVSGANAGSIGVTALNPILEGSIVANVVAGDRQRALAGSPNLTPSDQMPTGAAVKIAFVNNANGVANFYDVVLEPQADAGLTPMA
jgi:hypothetical protein